MDSWREFEPEIARIAARLTPDEMLQQDLAQEMRIQIWRAPEGKTRGWYLIRARSRAVNFMRRTAIDCPDGDLDRQVLTYGILGDIDPDVLRYIPTEWHAVLLTAPPDFAPESLSVSMETAEILARLTPRQQQVAYALSQGFTQGEVAAALNVSRMTVATELARVRATFRNAERED
jgi:RNA polymerase sigma factor (sigma-70 family)